MKRGLPGGHQELLDGAPEVLSVFMECLGAVRVGRKESLGRPGVRGEFGHPRFTYICMNIHTCIYIYMYVNICIYIIYEGTFERDL